ncbi:hypothetical protein AB0N16_04245 [Streptomyces sp. NPDC051105]|uniref:hypothetical protein n=1 Tax=Streptomyces sp. NPDC051105 TaxID=3154843 RepID=UPI003444CB6D
MTALSGCRDRSGTPWYTASRSPRICSSVGCRGALAVTASARDVLGRVQDRAAAESDDLDLARAARSARGPVNG